MPLLQDVHYRHPNDWWHKFVDWVAESRSHRVLALVACIWLLNAFDLDLTIASWQAGVLDEQNPVARRMLRFGPTCIVLYKIGLVLIGSYPLLKFRSARIAEMGAVVVLAAYIVLALRWATCFELYAIAISGETTEESLKLLFGGVR